MKNTIAGVVVLYNPDIGCIRKINSYISQIAFLYVVDNSEIKNSELYSELIALPKLKYIFNGDNLGVARALNQAVDLAKKDNYKFLLTMDQDSLAGDELIRHYENYLLSNDISRLGMLAPVPDYFPDETITVDPVSKEVDVAITSGCLVNLNMFDRVGPFEEKLFIDYVDFEYCLRLRKKGFNIVQLGNAKIFHQLGKLEKRKIIFFNIFVTHHSPERYYYRTRNRLYVAKKYINIFPGFILKDFFVFLNELLKILVYEKQKLAKFHSILLGLLDFLKDSYNKRVLIIN